MPVPALPYDESGTAGPTFTREFSDPLGRPMEGTVTLRRLEPPVLSISMPLASGRVTLNGLAPGRYSIGAMLRDVDGTRSYIAEEIEIP